MARPDSDAGATPPGPGPAGLSLGDILKEALDKKGGGAAADGGDNGNHGHGGDGDGKAKKKKKAKPVPLFSTTQNRRY